MKKVKGYKANITPNIFGTSQPASQPVSQMSPLTDDLMYRIARAAPLSDRHSAASTLALAYPEVHEVMDRVKDELDICAQHDIASITQRISEVWPDADWIIKDDIPLEHDPTSIMDRNRRVPLWRVCDAPDILQVPHYWDIGYNIKSQLTYTHTETVLFRMRLSPTAPLHELRNWAREYKAGRVGPYKFSIILTVTTDFEIFHVTLKIKQTDAQSNRFNVILAVNAMQTAWYDVVMDGQRTVASFTYDEDRNEINWSTESILFPPEPSRLVNILPNPSMFCAKYDDGTEVAFTNPMYCAYDSYLIKIKTADIAELLLAAATR